MSTVFAERPHFFEGQYLGAADLDALLVYLREQQARHLLGAHTWGIVAGIDLVGRESPSGDLEYFLTPGIAIDGYGRLIVVAAPHPIGADLFATMPGGLVSVWIGFVEIESGGVRRGFEVCDTQDAFRRMSESFTVEVGARDAVAMRESGVTVADETFEDAREAQGDGLPGAPLMPDGSVPAQLFPPGDEPSRWLVPVGRVPWQAGAPGSFGANDDATRRQSRLFRRHAGIVAEQIVGADGLLRLGTRHVARIAGQTVEKTCSARLPQAKDLLLCDERVQFREPIWLEAHTRFLGDARVFGRRLEFHDDLGLDYQAAGVVTALRRRADKNALGGVDLQVLLGKSQGGTRPTRLTIGAATVTGTACATDFTVTAGIVMQEDARLGIGTDASALGAPLTIRATGDNGDVLAVQAPDGTLAWQVNRGANGDGLNFTRTDPAATQVFFADDGNVGIGTLDPQAKLDIRGLPGSLGLGGGKWFQVGDGDDSGRLWLQYGEQNAPLLVLSDKDDPPRLQFQQTGGGTETGPAHASWIGHASPNSSDLAVLNGRLGIGTLAPFTALTVQGSLGFKSGSTPMLYIHESGTANADRMVLAHSPAWPDWGIEYRDAGDQLAFVQGGSDVLCVDLAARKVGIGTSSPQAQLDVRGDVRLGGGGELFAVGGVQNLRTIAGSVSSVGNAFSGTGFSAAHLGTGAYRLTFTHAFASAPVVVVTVRDDIDNAVAVTNTTATTCDIQVIDVAPAGGNENDPQDCAFNFIAIGLR